MKKLHHLLLIILLIIFCFSACRINPVTRTREFNVITEERELSLGRNANYSIIQKMGLYEDPALEKYINDVGQSLVAVCDRNSIPYEFHVIDSPILNAFALPGGYVFITRGLLAELENEAQLASVLGHEIGHVCARHSATQLSEALGMQLLVLASLAAPGTREMAPVATALTQSITLGYSREREFQADAMGLSYMYRAGYDPIEVSTFLFELSKKSQGPGGYSVYNSTHPDIFDRISTTRNLAKQMVALDIPMKKIRKQQGAGQATVTREEVSAYHGKVLENKYKSHLDGLLYGPREASRRIRIYTVQKGDTFKTIAQNFLSDPYKASEIAEFNELEVDTHLQAGQKLKVIF